MEKDNVTDIKEKLKELQEKETEGKINAAERKVTDPILTEKLLINHKERKKFSIKDLLR
mgnify:CR=1 FL=1